MIRESDPPTSFQLVILPVKMSFSCGKEISVSGLFAFTKTRSEALATFG